MVFVIILQEITIDMHISASNVTPYSTSLEVKTKLKALSLSRWTSQGEAVHQVLIIDKDK